MKVVSGHTIPFAVLGHPIGHSLSPVMHNASFDSLGLDAIYLAFDVHPDSLMAVLPSMQKMGFKGVNLTVPLKEVAFRGIEDLDASAKVAGAVNTVEFCNDGSMRGHSTDARGFLTALDEAFQADVKNMAVFVLGTGGAGRTVATACAQGGCGSLVLADIDDTRTNALARELSGIAPKCKIEIAGENRTSAVKASDLIIQATPVGMKPEDKPLLTADSFRDGQILYDMIYMYPETGIMKEASAAGARCANGLGMLLHQGAVAFKIWTGLDPDTEAMRKALEDSVYGS